MQAIIGSNAHNFGNPQDDECQCRVMNTSIPYVRVELPRFILATTSLDRLETIDKEASHGERLGPFDADTLYVQLCIDSWTLYCPSFSLT